MKKLFFLTTTYSALFALFGNLTFAENEMPKLYGQVAKELEFVNQEEKFQYKSHSGITDLENSETRLGAKGSYVFEDLNADYVVELGINSARQDKTGPDDYKDTSGRIRIRLANIKFKTEWGTITVGQDFTPTSSLQTKKFDPLAATGAGLAALGHDNIFEAPVKMVGLGAKYLGRRDGWGYQTPSLKGFNYTVWTDHGDDADLNPATTLGEETWEHVIEYAQELTDGNLNLYVANTVWNQATKEDENYLLFGWNFGMGKFGFSGSLGQSEVTAISTDKTEEKNYLQLGLSYKLSDKNIVAVTFASQAIDKGTSSNDSDKSNLNQVALGWIHQYNKNLKFHVIAYQLEYSEEDEALAETNDNSALVTAAGAILSF